MVRCASRILTSHVRITSWFEVALRIAWNPSRILRSLVMRPWSDASFAPRSACGWACGVEGAPGVSPCLLSRQTLLLSLPQACPRRPLGGAAVLRRAERVLLHDGVTAVRAPSPSAQAGRVGMSSERTAMVSLALAVPCD